MKKQKHKVELTPEERQTLFKRFAKDNTPKLWNWNHGFFFKHDKIYLRGRVPFSFRRLITLARSPRRVLWTLHCR